MGIVRCISREGVDFVLCGWGYFVQSREERVILVRRGGGDDRVYCASYKWACP